ncbi:hypothetical protein G3578_09430 [Brevibacillus sp. SYP-B805]|uniref:hypothetical protein n=1 Tax=Brevibacillus sp. SYP-B805 TaxID=1578199 RepID=UPI0013EC25AA|nr:hypothetical protein [Brevibacillus sp. SYP-B805]NGQ95376.1 hypothetical protein [Brevibacillus sp. SYP-B805]
MIERCYEWLEALLSRHGEITHVRLCTERSWEETDEQLEMILYFSAGEEVHPIAAIHLFPLDELTCEVEVEITFDQMNGGQRDARMLWQQAQEIVQEVSLTERKRFLSPERLAEHELVLDYHFMLSMPQSEEEDERLLQTLQCFAEDVGRLVQL